MTFKVSSNPSPSVILWLFICYLALLLLVELCHLWHPLAWIPALCSHGVFSPGTVSSQPAVWVKRGLQRGCWSGVVVRTLPGAKFPSESHLDSLLSPGALFRVDFPSLGCTFLYPVQPSSYPALIKASPNIPSFFKSFYLTFLWGVGRGRWVCGCPKEGREAKESLQKIAQRKRHSSAHGGIQRLDLMILKVFSNFTHPVILYFCTGQGRNSIKEHPAMQAHNIFREPVSGQG